MFDFNALQGKSRTSLTRCINKMTRGLCRMAELTLRAMHPAQIWGLDFGDCHKSLFAHGDSVMQVSFVPNTHYVFLRRQGQAAEILGCGPI